MVLNGFKIASILRIVFFCFDLIVFYFSIFLNSSLDRMRMIRKRKRSHKKREKKDEKNVKGIRIRKYRDI